jgi:endonuclease YncB( thermonuclease family)
MVFDDEYDWKKYPELRREDLEEFGLLSPHEQITGDFVGEVVKVHDGDTVRMRVSFRDFDFPVRLLSIDAPELSTGSVME